MKLGSFFAVVSCALALLPACVTTQILAEESSGQVGCPPEEITITNKRDGAFNLVWKAQCRGVTYFCTFGDPTSCKEEAGGPSAAPPTPPSDDTPAAAGAGSQYATQCKGERICEAGRCVDPSATRSVPAPEPAPTSAPTPAPASAPKAAPKAEVGPTPPPR
jgi:hypothetical protein